MNDGFKVLAQAVMTTNATPTAGAAADLIYQVPTGSGERTGSRRISNSIISSIVICNSSGLARTYTIRVVTSADAGTFSDKQYISYLIDLAANNTDVLSLGIGLASGDAIYAQASDADVAINIFGTEVV